MIFDSSLSHTAAPQACTLAGEQGVTSSPALLPAVGAVPQHRSEPLTDESREEAIQLAGRLFLKHWARYEATSCLAAKGDADRALRLQNLLIAGRK